MSAEGCMGHAERRRHLVFWYAIGSGVGIRGSCPRVKGLKTTGGVENDAEMAREWWDERCRSLFWVNLGKRPDGQPNKTARQPKSGYAPGS